MPFRILPHTSVEPNSRDDGIDSNGDSPIEVNEAWLLRLVKRAAVFRQEGTPRTAVSFDEVAAALPRPAKGKRPMKLMPRKEPPKRQKEASGVSIVEMAHGERGQRRLRATAVRMTRIARFLSPAWDPKQRLFLHSRPRDGSEAACQRFVVSEGGALHTCFVKVRQKRGGCFQSAPS